MAALELPFGYKQTTASSNIDVMYGPYASIAEANTKVILPLRKPGRTVGIIINGKIIEYWWQEKITNDGLVVKNSGGGVTPGGGGTIILGDNNFYLEEDENGNQILFSNIELIEEKFIGVKYFELTNIPAKILGIYLNGIRLDSTEYVVTTQKNIELLTSSFYGTIFVQYNKYIK